MSNKTNLWFNKIDRYGFKFFICQINSIFMLIFEENNKLKFICYILIIEIYMCELYNLYRLINFAGTNK